jgi:methionyl aminopeptidase
MRVNDNATFTTNELIVVKDQQWLDRQRIAGKVAAKTLLLLEGLVREKTVKSLQELSKIAEDFIVKNECKPTFLGYRGFPSSVCISVNRQLVHGIPSDYVLQEGDFVSFDLGTTYEGAIADTAITCIYGEPKLPQHAQIVRATEEALMNSIAAIKVGERLGIIGNAISRCARRYGFSVVSAYGGHGLEHEKPHAAPFVSNKSSPEEGIRIQAGMTLAIEPLFVLGNSNRTRVMDDGWTVVCDDLCSHHEHTIFVHEDRVEIITDRNR